MPETLSQLRYDPLQRRWVIIASERGRRPTDFIVPKDPHRGDFCPFCPGNETKTPPEIRAIRRNGTTPNTPGWQVRVVPNKFPALKIEGDPNREGVGMYDRMNGIGAHEVIIEAPEHEAHMADRDVDGLALVFRMYRERLNDLMRDRRFKYVLIFKNHGLAAGASLAHPHSQIIATTVTPRTVALELNGCRDHHQVKERCLICDIIKQEIADRERIIAIDDRYIAFTPYASRFPFEAFVAPRFHQHDFARSSDYDLQGFAAMMRDVLGRLKRGLDDPPYNFIVHSSPNSGVIPRRSHYWDTIEFDFHWHVEILPRLTRIAGFEWGTGFYINPTAPEEAAKFLRSV